MTRDQLDQMTKAQLLEEAMRLGVQVDKKDTAVEIKEKILAKGEPKGEQAHGHEKKAFLVCPACGGTAFKYDKSKSGGLIGLECEDPGCGKRIVATPPVVITDADGHQIQLEFNEGDIVTRQKVRGENEGFATVSIRVPIAVRNRFRYAILVAKKIQGSDERGMYPASVFEYMIEGFLQEHEAEVAPADLEIIRKKVEGEVVPTADPNQTSLPGLDGPGPEDGDPEAGGDPESEGSEFEN